MADVHGNDYMPEQVYAPHSGAQTDFPQGPSDQQVSADKIGDAQGLANWGAKGCPPEGPAA
jgi:hypothetical protein